MVPVIIQLFFFSWSQLKLIAPNAISGLKQFERFSQRNTNITLHLFWMKDLSKVIWGLNELRKATVPKMDDTLPSMDIKSRKRVDKLIERDTLMLKGKR